MANYNDSMKIVKINVEFIWFGTIDTVNERYQALVCIESKWYEDTELEEYNSKLDWNPRIYIENACYEKLNEDVSYNLKIEDNKTLITETRYAEGLFWERMELPDFPLDIQELSIIVCTKHKPSICRLVTDDRKLSFVNPQALFTFKDQQQYKLYRLVKTSSYASYDTSASSFSTLFVNHEETKLNKSFLVSKRRSKYSATAFCSRRPTYYIANAYSFNFLITVLALTIFSYDLKATHSRISSSFTLILTSFSFKVITSRTLPTISYMTSLDKYQIINIVYLALCCVWHSISGYLNFSDNRVDIVVLYCFIFLFLFIQIVFAIALLLSYKKIRTLEAKEKNFLEKVDAFNMILSERDTYEKS